MDPLNSVTVRGSCSRSARGAICQIFACGSFAGDDSWESSVELEDPHFHVKLERRVSEGRTKTEAIRCIKRYIAREVFAALPQTAAG